MSFNNLSKSDNHTFFVHFAFIQQFNAISSKLCTFVEEFQPRPKTCVVAKHCQPVLALDCFQTWGSLISQKTGDNVLTTRHAHVSDLNLIVKATFLSGLSHSTLELPGVVAFHEKLGDVINETQNKPQKNRWRHCITPFRISQTSKNNPKCFFTTQPTYYRNQVKLIRSITEHLHEFLH